MNFTRERGKRTNEEEAEAEAETVFKHIHTPIQPA